MTAFVLIPLAPEHLAESRTHIEQRVARELGGLGTIGWQSQDVWGVWHYGIHDGALLHRCVGIGGKA